MNTDPQSTRNWQNSMLGRYRLTRLLGRGGMGEVWLAEDTQLRRQVAIKLLSAVYQADRDYLQDVTREAQAAAALEHPHILPIHDVGEQQVADDLISYLVTPYITGGSLLERMQRTQDQLPPDVALDYLRQAADAIDYAHSQNILHRDIKPANMLLQGDWLFLADFGLAKLLAQATMRNRTFAGSGTPEYMAPEQIQGKAVPASDRYSFAITAYQLLTKRVPFKGDTLFQTMIKQISEPPPSPRNFNPDMPEEAEQALLLGLAKQPGQRFASCMALVRALETSYGIHPQAVSTSGSEQRSLWPSTNPPVDRLGALPQRSAPGTPHIVSTPSTGMRMPEPAVSLPPTVPASAPAGSSSGVFHTPSQPQTQSVPTQESQRSGVGKAVPVTGGISRRALLIGGGTVALAGIGGVVFYTLQRTQRGGATTTTPAKPIPGPRKLISGVPQLSLTAHTKSVSAARWDASGRYLATAAEDSYIMLWDLDKYLQQPSASIQALSTPTRSWKVANPILENGLSWSNDGRTLAVVTGDDTVSLFDAFGKSDTAHTYQDAHVTTNAPAYTEIAWSTTNGSFATISYSPGQKQQQVALWQTNHPNAPTNILHSDTSGAVRTAIIDSDHPYNATANLNGISWSQDGVLLAGHTNFGQVTVWQSANGNIQQVLELPNRPSQDKPLYVLSENIAWSPTASRVLAAADMDVVTIWDVSQKQLLLTVKVSDPVPFVTGLSWSSNGKYLAGSYAQSGRIYIWDAPTSASPTGQTQAEKFFFPPPGSHVHSATITDVAWSPDGRYIASASGDSTVVVWRVSD